MYKEWTATVDEIAHTNLEKPLLVRDPNTLMISVNFDPQVCTVCVRACVCVFYMCNFSNDCFAMLFSWWPCFERSST